MPDLTLDDLLALSETEVKELLRAEAAKIYAPGNLASNKASSQTSHGNENKQVIIFRLFAAFLSLPLKAQKLVLRIGSLL
jgi:hypothetical protein